MIKKYKQFNEGLLDKLQGPTDEEVMKHFNNLSPSQMLSQACKTDYLPAIKLALSKGGNIFTDDDTTIYLYEHKLITEKQYLDLGNYINNNHFLTISVRLKSIEGIKSALKRNAKVYLTEYDLFQKIIKILKLNDDQVYEMMWDLKAPELLRVGAYVGCLNAVIYALDTQNTDVHANDDYALRVAAERGDTEIVRVTLQHGAYPIMCKGIMNMNKDIKTLLKEYESNNDGLFDEYEKLTPNELLYKSCGKKFFKGIKKAIEDGADVTMDNYYCFFTVKDDRELFDYLFSKTNLPNTLKEYMDDLMKDVKVIEQTKYPDTIYWGKDDEIIFELDKKYNILLINEKLIQLADRVYIKENFLDHRTFFELLKPYIVKYLGLSDVIYSNEHPHWTHDVPKELPHAAYKQFHNEFEYYKDKLKKRTRL